MAEITIKRKTAGGYEELYPTTTVAQVTGLQTALDARILTSARGAANGVASLDSSGLVPASQLGSYIQGGVRITGVMSQAANDTVGELIGVLETIVTNSSGAVTREELIGYAFIGSANFQLTQGTLPTNTAFTINPGDEGDATVPIDLEAGDILLVSNYSFSSPTHTYTFAVINNTYGAATSSSPGVVQVLATSGATAVVDFGNSTSVVRGIDITNMTDFTGDQNGRATGFLVGSGHTHSQYQPLDTELTAIAGLAVTDSNIIVGNGTTWVAESGSTARTSLGVAIGTDVQAYDPGLQSIAGLTTAANKMIYTTASDTYAVADLTAAGRALLDDADAAAQRTTLGLAIGTNVQAYDAELAAIAGLAVTDSNFIVGNGTTWVVETGATARASLGVYSTTEVDNKFTNRPQFFYDSTSGIQTGDYLFDDDATA
jgi:hypothetical protein